MDIDAITIEQCKRCNVPLVEGEALQNRLAGLPDFIGDTGREAVCTVSYSREADLIECLKCPECGYSVTRGREAIGARSRL